MIIISYFVAEIFQNTKVTKYANFIHYYLGKTGPWCLSLNKAPNVCTSPN